VPVISGAPRSAPAEAFTKLATEVFGSEKAPSAEATPVHEERKGGLLSGLLRR
jgi:hypothetical protein